MTDRRAREVSGVSRRVSARFASRFHQHYARAKIISDPVYGASLRQLESTSHPILDVGCGLGLLGHFMVEHGFEQEILGIDADERKIAAARWAAVDLPALRFEVADAREPREFEGNVALLDVLHYFSDDDQQKILSNAADYARPGDVVIIRDCIRDGTWRYRLTWLEETFATSVGWLRGERLNFPTRDSIVEEFLRRGFDEEVEPLWGKTPFNNYLLTFRCR